MPRNTWGALLIVWASGPVLAAAQWPAAPARPVTAESRPVRPLPFQIAQTDDLAGRSARPSPARDTRAAVPVERAELSGPVPTAPATHRAAIPLPPPRDTRSEPAAGKTSAGRTRGGVALLVTGSLAMVLGLFFLVIWLSRRALPKSQGPLPTDVLELLGRTPLAARHHLQLIRLGRRLLLVSVSPDGAETLSEITDPDEVNHLAALCKQDDTGSISASFRHVLQQWGGRGETTSAAASDLAELAPRR